MDKTDATLFDEIVEMLIMSGAEEGSYTFLEKTQRGVTYLLCDCSDRAYGAIPSMIDGIMAYTVYAIPSKDDFIFRLRDRLGEETFDVFDADVNEAIWEVLNRYEIVNFDDN